MANFVSGSQFFSASLQHANFIPGTVYFSAPFFKSGNTENKTPVGDLHQF